jgi:outer membrane immunogenic protein
MKNLLQTSAVLMVLAASPAMAADIAVKAPPPAAVPVYSWTGYYVGGNVGGVWSDDKASLVFPDALGFFVPVTNTGGAAFIGGVQQGFNWQFDPRWVWGLEADWSFTNAGRSVSQRLLSVAGQPVFASSGTLGTRLDWVGSARNRLGFLIIPSVMLYGTGGVAFGKIDYTGAAAINNPLGFVYSANTAFNKTAVGWTAGAGVEWMITQHWLLRGEYLFYDLSSAQNVSSTNPLVFHGLCIVGFCPPPSTTTAFAWGQMRLNEVRAALSYKF